MDDSKRLSLLEEYLSSTLLKTTFEKKKDLLRAVFQDGLLALQQKTNLQLLKLHRQ